jgi:SAM-dependent methyltransferase
VAPWLAPHADSLTCLAYQGQGRLLEYGCGAGWLGHRLRHLGWDVTGMDVNPYAAEQARRLFGLPVIVGTLPHSAVQPQSYDVIVMGAVLEHVHQPHDVIEAAAQALRPGGYLVASVPNFDSWGFRRFRGNWWGLQLPVHLLHFTPATLRRLLEAHRLEVRQESQPVRTSWMRRSMAAARHDKQPGHSWLRVLGWSRLATGLLARWAAASGHGDCLLMIAHRSENIPLCGAA